MDAKFHKDKLNYKGLQSCYRSNYTNQLVLNNSEVSAFFNETFNVCAVLPQVFL